MNITVPKQETVTTLLEETPSSFFTSQPAAFEMEIKKAAHFPFEMEEAALRTLHLALEEEKLLIEGIIPAALPLAAPAIPTPIFSSGSAIEVTAEVAELFEKCVSSMVHIDTAGITETTFYLDTPQFSGAKIVIREFNTAPKAFNISLVGAPEAVALFNLHAQELLSAFKKYSFNFTVHRLESDIDLHLIKKIDAMSDQEEDEEK